MAKRRPSWAAPPPGEVQDKPKGPRKKPGPRSANTTPSLLQHPNLPKPMHGMNPRTLLGQAWWDEKRRAAYAERDFHCWACGVHKLDAQVHQWLEGHEEYKIDYTAGRMEFVRVVALCHFCHSFIHSGRLMALHEKGEITSGRFKKVIVHGLNVLHEAGAFPWPETVRIALLMADANGWSGYKGWPIKRLSKLWTAAKKADNTPSKIAAWGKWRLVIEGKEFKPLHEDMDAWRRAYDVFPGDE